MKQIVLLAITFIIGIFNLFAQDKASGKKIKYSVNAGTTLTFLPDFQHSIIVVDEWVVPGYYILQNGRSRSFVTTPAKTELRLGWYAEVEATYHLPRHWNLSFSAGIKKLRFDYETNYQGSFYYSSPIHIDAIDDKFGFTRLTYVTIAPFNVSRIFFDEQLRIQAGPALNFLLKDKINNTLILHDENAAAVGIRNSEGGIFDAVGKVSTLMYGLNVRFAYKISDPVDVNVGAQYFFNSLYESESPVEKSLTVEKLNPLVVDIGVSIKPFML